MGRQIAIAATLADEMSILEFMRTSADIRIAENTAPRIDDFWVDRFHEDVSRHGQYWIWNTSFAWTPTFAQVNAEVPGSGGWYYIENIFQAPVVQFLRMDWNKSRPGRLYWAKELAAADGLAYDATAFGMWYDQIVRWVRRNGKKMVQGGSEPYYLPDAYARIMREQ